MGETVTTACPWCGEPLEVWVERDAVGTAEQDCDVCCRPCVIETGWDDERGAWAIAQRE
jgi:hypothetical protein